jgi:hypothetical protein
MFGCSTPDATGFYLQEAGTRAILQDRRQNGLYARIWRSLWEEGLRDRGAVEGKQAARRYVEKLRRRAETQDPYLTRWLLFFRVLALFFRALAVLVLSQIQGPPDRGGRGVGRNPSILRGHDGPPAQGESTRASS